MAVVMILSLTLIMAAYQMFATVNDEGGDELYYQQAMSFSEVLRSRLEKNTVVAADIGMTDELTGHIDAFMEDAAGTGKTGEILKASAPESGGAYGGITLVMERQAAGFSRNYLVLTISVDDGDRTMASCKCKYAVTKDAEGKNQYSFCEYY